MFTALEAYAGNYFLGKMEYNNLKEKDFTAASITPLC